MGYDITKRISVLRKQVEEDRIGQWGAFRTLLIALLLLWVITVFILPSNERPVPEDSNSDSEAPGWHQQLKEDFAQRKNWLDESSFVFPGSTQIYTSFSVAIFKTFPTKSSAPVSEEDIPLFDVEGVQAWIGQVVVAALLRIGFVVIASWPIWLLALLLGYISMRHELGKKNSESVLGVCDRGKGPFYSGIYGPFRPNNSFSGTDFSCPGLACPTMTGEKTAQAHKLAHILRQYNALNETNLSLVRIILNHKDFPCFVEDENVSSEDREQRDGANDDRISQTGYFTNELGTIEQSSLVGLAAALEAQQRLTQYINSLEARGVKSSVLNKNYTGHLANIEKLTKSASPLTALLIRSLTPNRMWALGHLSSSVVASAYLAIEAGKCLVYKRHGEGFVKISEFPHLQARAVIHSLPSYHRDYQGDLQLIIRQAVICSRRHGDFGRVFLPNRMPIESRVVRDWLEILYAPEDKREDVAQLVELDEHIEEISINWRLGLSSRLQKSQEKSQSPKGRNKYWKGLVYKSVVMMPLLEILDIALKGIHKERRKRITELLEITRRHQTRISISARLPGFKRQAMEADSADEKSNSIIQAITSQKNGEEILERWRIVRRVLTKYNWLSTRVGDDAVPVAGLVQASISIHGKENKTETIGLDALAPLRQRRFSEFFGQTWELDYYVDSPAPEDLEVFVDNRKFTETLKEKHGENQSEKKDSDKSDKKDDSVPSAASG